MFSGGGVTWNLNIESKKFDTVINKARGDIRQLAHDGDKDFKNLEDKGSSALGGLASAARVAVKAIAVIGTAVTAAGGFAIKSAANFEQTRIGLENMLGSADKARDVLGQVSKFAAETPFEFPELAQATRQLIAFGFNAEDGIRTMKQLGDVSAAVGAPINDLAYLMGTLKTQGRAFTIDIRQFAQRGIPIYEYLAKVLKTNEKAISEMIEAGKIGFPEVQKAFSLMTSEGGKFHGTMAKQSKSLTGLFSTLKDNIGQTAREFIGISQEGDIKSGSIFDKTRQGATWLIENLPAMIAVLQTGVIPTLAQWGKNIAEVAATVGEHLNPKFVALWHTIDTRVMPVMSRLWDEIIKPLIPVFGTVLVVALGLSIDAFNLLLTTSSALIDFLIANKDFLLPIIAAFGALKTAMMLQAAFVAIQAGFATLTTVTIPTVAARFTALSALIATPMVMPAIVIAAALAAIWQVYDAGKKLQRELSNTMDSIASFGDARADFIASLGKAKREGRIDQTEYNRRLNTYNAGIPGNALGTDNWKGGPTWVGERGPELVNLPRGSEVIPNHEAGGAMGQKNEYHIGTINISSDVDGERWLKKLTRNQEIFDNGLIPSRTAM